MPSRPDMILPRLRRVIFKAVGDGRPYPDHGYTTPRQWSKVAPRQVRLDELVTTKRTLDLAQLLSEDSTFYGRSEEHTSELQSHVNIVCRLLLEKKKHNDHSTLSTTHEKHI